MHGMRQHDGEILLNFSFVVPGGWAGLAWFYDNLRVGFVVLIAPDTRGSFAIPIAVTLNFCKQVVSILMMLYLQHLHNSCGEHNRHQQLFP